MGRAPEPSGGRFAHCVGGGWHEAYLHCDRATGSHGSGVPSGNRVRSSDRRTADDFARRASGPIADWRCSGAFGAAAIVRGRAAASECAHWSGDRRRGRRHTFLRHGRRLRRLQFRYRQGRFQRCDVRCAHRRGDQIASITTTRRSSVSSTDAQPAAHEARQSDERRLSFLIVRRSAAGLRDRRLGVRRRPGWSCGAASWYWIRRQGGGSRHCNVQRKRMNLPAGFQGRPSLPRNNVPRASSATASPCGSFNPSMGMCSPP